MDIIVCVKQVPARQGEGSGRESVPLINNPNDLNALEEALRIKELADGSRVTTLSMGPPGCEGLLRELLAAGADEAVLLSSPGFAGSDTYATSKILAAAVHKLLPFDLILTGERAIDGETGQVGPGLAAILEIPHQLGVEQVLTFDPHSVIIDKVNETYAWRIRLPIPALLTIRRSANTPRIPSIRGRLAASSKQVIVWDQHDLGLSGAGIGSRESPTQVIRTVKSDYSYKSRGAAVFIGEHQLDEILETVSAALDQPDGRPL
ncbi:electron transfer flavoprotein subunit beta/FixA family protein [Paenibacillus tepidiphilus]|uniref:electron transfer flavoprotein subunit beta/FixA family protein n=1 Tax=Paenibacillus tepidiphilus TaxID=2608683 RepID=UPI001239569F|nr:electron transfer flavoprotein subunit beta/FixA family protein [Paenibacillus tepidiphilus]